jgi:DNA-binding MarR family transcriptional regulator
MKLEDEITQQKFKSEYQKAAVNLVFTYNWMNSFYADRLKRHDITIQQFNILRILRGQYPKTASIKLLKERMLDKMSDASRIVEKLRVKELVKRDVCPLDRRNVDVLITQKGLNLLKELDSIDTDVKKYFSNLDEKEVKKLNDLLNKLRG